MKAEEEHGSAHTSFRFHFLWTGVNDCSGVTETEETSGASFILCDAFNVRFFYATESSPYGCLCRDLHSDDYTELWVITWVLTIMLDRRRSGSS